MYLLYSVNALGKGKSFLLFDSFESLFAVHVGVTPVAVESRDTGFESITVI